MSDVSGVSAKRHFSGEEEETLRHDESTSGIVKRDGRTTVDISGTDRSWQSTKHHQQEVLDNKIGGLEVVLTTIHGAELAGAIHVGGIVATGLAGGGAILGFGLGAYSLYEAHEKANEQNAALTREYAHVALIGVLDLPESYKATRLEGDYRSVSKEPGSQAFKMAEGLRADAKGLAVLQLHADRGMNAARDLSRAGIDASAFFRANPRAAESYAMDAAFREGFDAYRHTRATQPPDVTRALDRKLDERDGWYAQSHVTFRV
jgi:hypothetical protein